MQLTLQVSAFSSHLNGKDLRLSRLAIQHIPGLISQLLHSSSTSTRGSLKRNFKLVFSIKLFQNFEEAMTMPFKSTENLKSFFQMLTW